MVQQIADGATCLGKRVVVSGSSHGIGKAVAASLVREGARVVVNGRDATDCQRAADALGGEAVPCPADVTEPGAGDHLIEACTSAFGGIDAVVNCAGDSQPAQPRTILTTTPDVFAEHLRTHLLGTFQVSQAAARVFADQGDGVIVNTASTAALGTYGGSGYPAAMSGIIGMSLSMANELAASGVRVNVVCPAARTRLTDRSEVRTYVEKLFHDGLIDEVTMEGAINPPGPEYAAQLYSYLVSDLAGGSADGPGINGGVFTASGNFIGRLVKQAPVFLGYRDHEETEPWQISEIAEFVGRESAF